MLQLPLSANTRKGTSDPKGIRGTQKRTQCRHEHNRKELEKKGFTSVIHWFSATQKENDGGASTECSSSQAEPNYVSSDLDDSDDDSDDEVRNVQVIERAPRGSTGTC